MAWVFNLIGLADLIVSAPGAVAVQASGEPLSASWHVFIYYVPALLVTHLMMLGFLLRYADRLQRLYRAAFTSPPAFRPWPASGRYAESSR
jgi:hypothetical protein